MSATKFSFVAKLFGQMKEMSIKEINGGRENIRRKNKLQTASIMQTWQGWVSPSVYRQLLPYFKFMNEKFREKKFSGSNTKGRENPRWLRIWNNALSYSPGKSSLCIGKNKVAVTVCLIGSLDTIYWSYLLLAEVNGTFVLLRVAAPL